MLPSRKKGLLMLSVAGLFAFLVFAGAASMQSWLTPLTPVEDQIEAADELVDETPTAWFVELTSPPTSDGSATATVKREKDVFRANARRAGLSFTERKSFDKLWNGLSVTIAPSELPKLARIEGVKNLYPVETISVPDDEEVPGEQSTELYTALAMTGADIAQSQLGLTGQGIKVGIIDTGIDYHHPDLGGCFGPNCKVAYGHDFVGDAFANSESTPVPDNDPDDCEGHGTHVSGIVGANGGIRGVAPNVKLGAYRVFGCEGSTAADIMIEAMEMALEDDMDIVNISIGSSFQWPQYPTATAADRLVNKGVVVTASIGNSGSNGVFSGSAAGVGKKVIGVANFTNTHSTQNAFIVNQTGATVTYIAGNRARAAIPVSGTDTLARTGNQTITNDACNGGPSVPAPGSLTGKVALVRRGTCSFYEKALNAQNAGAKAVLFYNDNTGTPTTTPLPAVTQPTPTSPLIVIPIAAVNRTVGNGLDTRLAGGLTTTLTWTVVSTPITLGNRINASSSYGLSPDLTFKPDISAPGGVIRSTYPLEQGGGYTSLTGTSMSSPHVAGAVALLLEAKPRTPSNSVQGILQNNAEPRFWSGNPSLGLIEMAHRQGAGLLRIDDAILSTTKIEPAELALGESQFGPASTRTLTIENNGSAAVTYNISHLPAAASNGTFSPSIFDAQSPVSFSVGGSPATSITVPAGGTGLVDVTIEPNPGLLDLSVYGGYIQFTDAASGAVSSVPFAGFKGDYQAIQVLTPTPSGFPWLSKYNGSSYTNQPNGATYTMQGLDVPFFNVHMDHQSRRVKFEAFAVSGKAWHTALQFDHFVRNSTRTNFFAFAWDGNTSAGKKIYTVPNGQYVIRLTVEKALSDGSNPAHFETWTSPVITIARP